VIQDLVDEPAQLERFETALHDALRRAQERGELDARTIGGRSRASSSPSCRACAWSETATWSR